MASAHVIKLEEVMGFKAVFTPRSCNFASFAAVCCRCAGVVGTRALAGRFLIEFYHVKLSFDILLVHLIEHL